jgi:hypothetical protein
MTNRDDATRANPLMVLCWEFTRGDERISCQIARDPRTGTFGVALVTLKDLRRASVDTFHAAAAAFRRHATLASDLRGAGWKLAAYTE